MKDYILNYDIPSEHSDKGWQNQVLPIGNGYMGMCVFGGVNKEYLQFNEKTLWQGGPSKSRPDYMGGNIKDSYNALKDIQKALESNDNKRAKELKDKLIGIENGYGNYLNFGEVKVVFGHNNSSEYKRYLDINNAIAGVSYQCNNVQYNREYFANYPSRVIVARYSAFDKFGCSIDIDCAQSGNQKEIDAKGITIKGAVSDNGLKYYARLAVETDGNITAGDSVMVDNATYINYYLAAATDYKAVYPKYRGEEPCAVVDNIINSAVTKGYDTLKNEHINDYKKLFDRVDFDLQSEVPNVTTDKLIQLFQSDANSNEGKYYQELLYQYGRYLIIASSRMGSLAANLQGVWNNSNTPIWSSDYHLNVNLQMCYWHVYTANLAETAVPMIEYMQSLREPGRVTAKEYHNIVSDANNPENGWVCHTQCTPFGWTCPGWDFNWGWSPAASSWMMQNCYDYYKFTLDKEALAKDIYPMMRENAKFWLQNLIYNKEQDRWVSSPSYSPEHGPISVGNTYEQEMINILFKDTIEAAIILGVDKELVAKLEEIKGKLSPLHVGKWGQIKEWYEEDSWYKYSFTKGIGYAKHGFSPKHRHASHLIGLYPANDININTPKLYEAAKISLLERGLGSPGNRSGWGKANKIGMWARLHDSQMAFKLIKSLLSDNIADNLWDMHPPFQMDGNCGYTAGVCEMLLNSCNELVEILPALPQEWARGSVVGLVARGGDNYDISWSGGKATHVTIHSKADKIVKCLVNGKSMDIKTNKTIAIL